MRTIRAKVRAMTVTSSGITATMEAEGSMPPMGRRKPAEDMPLYRSPKSPYSTVLSRGSTRWRRCEASPAAEARVARDDGYNTADIRRLGAVVGPISIED